MRHPSRGITSSVSDALAETPQCLHPVAPG
jgi:hypothetical protein